MPRRPGVSPRPHSRKPNGKRETSIRQIMADGQTDPATIARIEGCSKELVLYYCRKMPDVTVEPWKPGPGKRRKMRVGWRLP